VYIGRFGVDANNTRLLADLAKELHSLPALQLKSALETLAPNTVAALKGLDYEWLLFARDKQLPPTGEWRWWVNCGGRGVGKTRCAVEYLLDWAWEHPGGRGAFISKDYGGYVKIMLNGKSGILRRNPPWFKAKWWKKDKLIQFPNDAVYELHTSEEPSTLRGPEYEVAWCEELFHWTIPRGEKAPKAWEEGIKFTLRQGEHPHGLITSTPVPTEFCMDMLLGRPDDAGVRPITDDQVDSGAWSIDQVIEIDGREQKYAIEICRGKSEENAENLSPGFVQEMRADYGATPLAEQELDGKIPRRPKGTLFKYEDLEGFCVDGAPAIKKVLIGVDPTRSEAPVDECGICVGGLGRDGHVYIWDDLSVAGSPKRYAEVIVSAANRNRADVVVLEKNRLPQKTRTLIRTTPSAHEIAWQEVIASENKQTRAEPTSKVVADGMVHFVRDRSNPRKFEKLWSELCWWDPRTSKRSPSRMDAFVWLVTAALKLDPSERKEIF
jgi:phage terminase large subunit-like protein